MADPTAGLDPRRLDPDAVLDALAAELDALPGVAARRREPIAAHLSLRCGGPAEIWAEVDDATALRAALKATRAARKSWQICWPFEDRIVKEGGLSGVVVRPGRGFEGVERRPADGDGPDRLVLGAATPWAACAAIHDASAPGPADVLRTWPGTPGATIRSGAVGMLEGLVCGLTWLKGRRTERVAVAFGAAPDPIPGTAVLASVEVPLRFPPGSRVVRDRQAPPPLGTLFDDPEGIPLRPHLLAAGLVGARLRSWRMARAEPGTLVNLGGGDARTALLFAKGMADHLRRSRGIEPAIRLQPQGVDGPRPR